jgi:hypothetical protein
MYCILLNERTGNAPVMSVYIVPVMVLTSAAKQNILHGAHFVLGKHVIDLGTRSDNVLVIVSCGGSV